MTPTDTQVGDQWGKWEPVAWRTRLVDMLDGFECSWQVVTEEPPKETGSRVVRRETVPLYAHPPTSEGEGLREKVATWASALEAHSWSINDGYISQMAVEMQTLLSSVRNGGKPE